MPTRKHPRLADKAIYKDPNAICSITTCVKEEFGNVFLDNTYAAICKDIIKQHARDTGVKVYAFSVMPDHLHLGFSPSRSHDVMDFVGQVKNLTQLRMWRTGFRGVFWQESFWDNVIKSDVQLIHVVRYIIHNAPRWGLVKKWRDHLYAGSLELDEDMLAGTVDVPPPYEPYRIWKGKQIIKVTKKERKQGSPAAGGKPPPYGGD